MSDQLTDEERATIDSSLGGGLVAYIHRMMQDHRPQFGKDATGKGYVGVCSCGQVPCGRWAFSIHIADLRSAYEAKVAGLRRRDTPSK